MKLTTPATASEPYTADAPPVTTSTRVIRICGRTSVSTVPSSLDGATRWPFSRIRVRETPKLRSERTLPEVLRLPLSWLRGVRPPIKTGSLLSASGISVGVVACSWSAVTAVIGVGDAAISEIRREPVTVTDSTLLSCAYAAVLKPNRLVAHSNAVFKFGVMEGPSRDGFVMWSNGNQRWQRCQQKNGSAAIFLSA